MCNSRYLIWKLAGALDTRLTNHFTNNMKSEQYYLLTTPTPCEGSLLQQFEPRAGRCRDGPTCQWSTLTVEYE